MVMLWIKVENISRILPMYKIKQRMRAFLILSQVFTSRGIET